jgi:hypothetical protein
MMDEGMMKQMMPMMECCLLRSDDGQGMMMKMMQMMKTCEMQGIDERHGSCRKEMMMDMDKMMERRIT